MRTFVLGICIFISSLAQAQRECVTATYLQEQQASHPAFINKLQEIETFIQRQKANARLNGEGSANVIKIPVVVHILFNTPEQNISEAQVKSQVEALNRDFRRDNSDSVNTPDRFKSLAADVQVEFELATVDPEGRATKGIVRRQTTVAYWKADDKIKYTSQGGDDAWDNRYYLNIWVGNLQYVIGYSSVPGSPSDRDGIVVTTSVFGTLGKGGAYNSGRTVVHETGHWLGLKHIWGDYYCGDDLVEDTPKQGNFTPGCPNTFRSSCENGTTGDMYMNYMDYTGDACMNLFTEGQKQRMRSLFSPGGPRNSLLYSKGLGKPWIEGVLAEEIPFVPFSKLYPNPATSYLVLNLDNKWMGKQFRIMNAHGVIVKTLSLTCNNQKIGLESLRPGLYFLMAENDTEKIREKFTKL